MADTAYQSTHTGSQIDEAVNKVLTTGEIAKMVRDEIRAQLSDISSGSIEIPVFNGGAMKYMTLGNFQQSIGIQKGNFGRNAGDTLTLTVSYGLLYIGDLSTGGHGLYAIGNYTPRVVSSIYNDNNSSYSVAKSGSSTVITLTTGISGSYNKLVYTLLKAV